MVDTPDAATAISAITAWYERSARSLPWRSPEAGSWAVLVSEVMLQQTPVNRVLPVYAEWMKRWPQPVALAQEAPGEALRVWGRLGYPRRALRLHAAAVKCVSLHGGDVPSGLAELKQLPGVGEYTAAAVASFAFGQRHAVLDTNVRRVHARWLDASEHPATSSPSALERRRALAILPTDPRTAATVSVAVMELGALVCTARTPRCSECPIAAACCWRRAGYPRSRAARRHGQSWTGTDRQCRGRLLAALREVRTPVTASHLATVWDGDEQRERALASLVEDGLIVAAGESYRLP